MKKLIYLLLFIPFFINLDVNAMTLSAPTFYQHLSDDSIVNDTANTIDNWSNTDVYVGGYIGSFGTNFPLIYQNDYNWFNLNLCSGKNVSISGSVHAIFGFFLNQSYTISFYMNNQPLVCSTSIFDNGNALHYDCFGETGGGTYSIYLVENSFSNNVNYHTAVSRNITYSCDVSNEAIVNQSITNTQNIINNQNTNTNAIIGAVGGSATDIINNQNTNTDKEIESQYVCKSYDKLNIVTDNRYLNSNGNLASNNNVGVTDYLDISKSKIFVLKNFSSDQGVYACFYNSSKEKISCINEYSLQTGDISVPANSNYVRFSIIKSLNLPTFKLCTNGNQALNDSISDINSSITSESEPDTSDFMSDFNDSVASDTPITNLLTLPLTLINAYNQGITATCSSYNLGSLLGTDIILPCINLEQRLGSNLWYIIDSLCCIFLIYSIAMLFVNAFDNLTSLKDDFDSIYVPKHAGKHVGSGVDG